MAASVVSSEAVPRLAATMVLLAPAAPLGGGDVSRFRVLMVRRHAGARFMPNIFVFPGGCVDPEDSDRSTLTGLQKQTPTDLPLFSERRAAMRELHEEAGVDLRDACPLADLTPILRLVTPRTIKYRYDTWFFVHCLPKPSDAYEVALDTREVSSYEWVTPSQALQRHRDRGDPFRMGHPQVLVMAFLRRFQSASALIEQFRSVPVAEFPRLVPEMEVGEGGKVTTRMPSEFTERFQKLWSPREAADAAAPSKL